MRRVALLGALCLLPLTACHGGDAKGFVFESTSGRRTVHAGDEIGGAGRLELPGDGWVELRRGTRVRVGTTPTVLAGDALASSTAIRAGAARAAVDGVARVRRSSGASLAVYRGRATIAALGRRLPAAVPAFRQVTVTDTGGLPRRAVPLTFDRRDPDPWDLRYLGEAIDLGDQLQRRSRALDQQLEAPAPLTPRLLRQVLPPLRSAPNFTDDLVETDRAVGETLVGASIALAGTGSLPARWRATFSFRSEGADWGLVALDQRARRAQVFGVLDGVLDRTPAAVPNGPRVTTITTAPRTTPTSPTTPTTPPPTAPPPTTPLPLPVDPLTPVVEGLLGTVNGLLSP